MRTQFSSHKLVDLPVLSRLPFFFALLLMLACGTLQVGIEGEATPASGGPGATVAALSTENARLVTQVAALARESARQATQVAALARKSAVPTAPAAIPAPPTPTDMGQWSSVGSMTTPRGLHTATLLSDGRVLLVGGYMALDTDTTSAEIFDPAANTFGPTGSLNTARHRHSATLLPDGRVLVIAGYGSGVWLSSAEIYDPATGQWSITQPIFAHGVNHTATLLKDGRVLVVAGSKQSGSSGPDDRVEIFNPLTNAWQKAALHQYTEGCHTATLLADGRVLIAGGYADPALYDPAGDTWQPAGKLAVARCFPQATLLHDGRVLLVGGILPSQSLTPTDSVEVYDPATNTWGQAAPLAQARYNQATPILLLPDGRVMVIGGAKLWEGTWVDPGAILSSVEIYDPAGDTWSPLPPLRQARADHTATLLPDGRVFVAGGRPSRDTFLDSAEILELGSR